MRKNRVLVAALVLTSAVLSAAQVVSPVELKDPALRALQLQYFDDLQQVGKEILADHFDYPFYLSRKLDMDEVQQKRADQHSIRFDHYTGQTVVAITGNYYVAYSAEKTGPDQRARTTFLNVVMPLLKAAVPRFQNNPIVQGYAVEVSHHILGAVMSVSMERPENLMVFLPQSSAIKLLGSKDDATQQAALLQGQVFLNAAPVTIWINGEGPQLVPGTAASNSRSEQSTPAQTVAEVVQGGNAQPQAAAEGGSSAVSKPPTPPRDSSPEALAALQSSSQGLLAKLVKNLEPQAHFVTYAAQSFVAFRQAVYLELSMNTTLPEPAGGSRYKVAAMAFDDHIAHLVRPVLGYFKDDPQFDGVSFSTTVHLAGKPSAAGKSQAVEFFFPFSALRCYERYDCTGQQLIDAGTVLANGERIGLDLQAAEAGATK